MGMIVSKRKKQPKILFKQKKNDNFVTNFIIKEHKQRYLWVKLTKT